MPETISTPYGVYQQLEPGPGQSGDPWRLLLGSFQQGKWQRLRPPTRLPALAGVSRSSIDSLIAHFLAVGYLERTRGPDNPSRPWERHTKPGPYLYRITPKGLAALKMT